MFVLGKKALQEGKKLKFKYIQSSMCLCGPKIAKCWEPIGTIALEKVLWDKDFVKIGYWAPKEQSSSKKGPMGIQNPKICYISAIMTL